MLLLITPCSLARGGLIWPRGVLYELENCEVELYHVLQISVGEINSHEKNVTYTN